MPKPQKGKQMGSIIEREIFMNAYGDEAYLEEREDGFFYSIIDGVRKCHAFYELAYGYIHNHGYRE